MPAPLPKVLHPVFSGLQVTTRSVVEPRLKWMAVDTSSAPVRWGDPVLQIAGGTIRRATPTDTALLGIAAAGTNTNLPVSIATMPLPTDSAGRSQVPVYLADTLTIFRGVCGTAPAQANEFQTHDLQYAIPDAMAPTPTITNAGTAGSTAYSYTITAMNGNGETLPGTAGTTATGNATLSAANYNVVTIPAQAAGAGIVSFGVYRGGQLIAIVPVNGTAATVLKDTGQAVISTAANALNTTGWAINLTAQSTNVVQIQSLDTTPPQPAGAGAGTNFNVLRPGQGGLGDEQRHAVRLVAAGKD